MALLWFCWLCCGFDGFDVGLMALLWFCWLCCSFVGSVVGLMALLWDCCLCCSPVGSIVLFYSVAALLALLWFWLSSPAFFLFCWQCYDWFFLWFC
jgi:hypothetical protein